MLFGVSDMSADFSLSKAVQGVSKHVWGLSPTPPRQLQQDRWPGSRERLWAGLGVCCRQVDDALTGTFA